MTVIRTVPKVHARRRTPRARKFTAGVALIASFLLAGACAQIPTSGSVQPGIDEVSVPRSGYLLAAGPTPGANQIEIVQGFLRALSAGPEDDFAVAREYLMGETRRTWAPAERVIVHPTSSSLEPVLEEDNTVHLMTPITATLDRDGRYAQAAEGVEEEFTFALEQNSEEEWRISRAPDATLMSAANFDFLYRATPIYFASQDQQRLVAELRWFSERNQATAAAATVLSGPSPWLLGATYPAVPSGVRLSTDGVTIVDGVAIVGLSDQVLNAPMEDRGVLAVEMQQTLLRIPNVHAVELQNGSVPLVMPTPLPTIDREPASPGSLMALGTDEEGEPALLEFANGPFTAREGLTMPEEPVHDFAVALADPDLVAAATDTGVLGLRADSETVTLLAQEGVTSVSWDRQNWLWVAREETQNQLVVINTEGEYQEIAADWLTGRDVIEARVARDGARILVISRDNAGTSLDVAAIVRDDEGRPQSLAEPLQLGGSIKNPTTAVWVDSLLIATLAEGPTGSEAVPYLIEVGGRTNSLPSVEDAKWLAAGKGERNLYLGAANGRIYERDGQTWSPIAEDVRDPHFPG